MAHDRIAQAIRMFGHTKAEVLNMKPEHIAPGMWAMSMLSDMQDHMEMGMVEVSPEAKEHLRQGMNMVKFWIDESRHVDSDDPRDR